MFKNPLTIVVCLLTLSNGATGEKNIRFVDSTEALGLTEPLKGIMSHAAACGDIDNDGDLDLYIGNFCDRPAEKYTGRNGPVPNMLLIRQGDGFRQSGQQVLAIKARTSGAVFADLDNDGDLDLFVSNNSKGKGLRVPSKLFENIHSRFLDVSENNAACILMGGRSIGILDYDADGLLDLLVAEDKWAGRHTRLFRNAGKLRFQDVSEESGLPADLPGLGVIAPDLNEDGWPDIFVGQANRMFLSKSDRTYREYDSKVFQYEPINREASPCGVAFGDLNRDGRMDIVIVDHSQPARQHVFINMGLSEGVPRFRDVTKEVGLDYEFPSWTPEGFHLKHAHVEIADFDNDGWPDILVAATYRENGLSRPFICRNLGRQSGISGVIGVGNIHFQVPPVEQADAHFPAGPTGDFDRDGRLDVFLAGWLPQIPSKLFLNRSEKNNWLRVRVVGRTINRMGIGTKVGVYKAGKIGQTDTLLGYQEIGTGFGFCSGQEAVAHFGLGKTAACDVEIILPQGRGTIRKTSVPVNQTLLIKE
jgi:hypothetical protein